MISSFLCSNIFIGFPIFGFWFFDFLDFEYLKGPQIVFYVSTEGKEETNCQLWMVIIQIRASKR